MTRNLTIIIACALILSIGTVSVPAQSLINPKTTSSLNQTVSERNAKVRADVTRLVADAKAGKIIPRSPQFLPPQSNSLSTVAKIAIVAGIVIVVLAIIIVHEVRDFHCESRCVL
jgi:cell division protein FtsL